MSSRAADRQRWVDVRAADLEQRTENKLVRGWGGVCSLGECAGGGPAAVGGISDGLGSDEV